MDKKYNDIIDLKRTVYGSLNKNYLYDTNLNNYLVEQRKIIARKNYQLDSRAQSLTNYGHWGFIKKDLNRQFGLDCTQ